MSGKNKNLIVGQELIKDYNLLFETFDNAVRVETEWIRKGDYFEQFTMYDPSYTPVETLGETTLTNKL